MFKLLTFDVSNTLLAPITKVGEQYAKVLMKQFGGGEFCVNNLQQNYEESFARHKKILPMYGLNAKLTTKQWWESVFLTTLINSKIATTEGIEFVGDHAKPELIADVPLIRFNPKNANPELVESFEDIYQNFVWEPLPNAANLLKELDKQKKLLARGAGGQRFAMGVITNNDERIHQVLKHHDMLKYMDFVVTSRETGYAKPDRRIFEIAMHEASKVIGSDVNSAETLHVGDSVDKDYYGAVKAGCRALLLQDAAAISDGGDGDIGPSDKNIPQTHCVSDLMDILDHVRA